MSVALSIFHAAVALAAAPLLTSIVNKTKAFFAGRNGPPWLQPYYDLNRLLRKGAVYSRTTTWVARVAPSIVLACLLIALFILPFAHEPGLFGFAGDFVLLAYSLGLARLFTVWLALDTGSAFQGMGANREMLFSALAEPALMLGLAALARETLHDPQSLGRLTEWSLADLHHHAGVGWWAHSGGLMALILVAWFIVLLAENSRIPVDDPNTHLELTMIHEVMILDVSGPDLAFILYGAALKLWIFSALLVGTLLPLNTGIPILDTVLNLGGTAAIACAVGLVESVLARVRMPQVPQLLTAASALAVLALMLEIRTPEEGSPPPAPPAHAAAHDHDVDARRGARSSSTADTAAAGKSPAAVRLSRE